MIGKASYNSIAYFGRQGAGKTLQMMWDCIKLACDRRRGIVGNLWLKPEGFYNFGVKYKLDWLKRIADEGQIVTLPSDSDMDLLFRYPYSIVMFDEAGAKMFSRNFQSNNKNMIEQGVQLRKNYCTLLWTAQYENMADKFLRATVERCVWCDGISKFDWKTQKDYLTWRSSRYFIAREFWVWVDDPKLRMHPIQSELKNIKHDQGPVTQRHKDIFNCFDSHSILGSSIDRAMPPIILSYRYRKDLPKSYYLLKCREKGLDFIDDPLTRMRYEYRDTLTTEEYINYLAYENDPFFAMPPPQKLVATACHFPGYFEAERPLPIYTSERNLKKKSEKITPIKKHGHQFSENKDKIDPRILEALKK